ncbi:MAG: hypothetical protein BGO23_03730 [Solirubrobacterales bacterium 67-14]|nr:MAG: hypothetical protein BGO23_03730 [Solirubrobacterales bacterium 67-14]
MLLLGAAVTLDREGELEGVEDLVASSKRVGGSPPPWVLNSVKAGEPEQGGANGKVTARKVDVSGMTLFGRR